jgi:hypothetical protein
VLRRWKNWSFVPANKTYTQQLQVMAYDGRQWSAAETLAVEIVAPPIYKPDTVIQVSEQLQSIPVDSLFIKLDDGPDYSSFEVYDPDADVSRGYFELDGDALAANTIHELSVREYERTNFYTGGFYNRSLDTIYVRASNPMLTGPWEKLDIRTEPEFEDVLDGGISWSEFLPRDDQGRVVITYSFMQQFPDYETGEAIDGEAPENFSIFNSTQRANTKAVFASLEEIANVKMQEVADTSTNILEA